MMQSWYKLFLDYMHKCTYNINVDVEWDNKKAITNLKKHAVDFADAVTVLEEENAITILEGHPDEACFVTIGLDIFNLMLVVVHTRRESRIRIISARKATSNEIKQYEG